MRSLIYLCCWPLALFDWHAQMNFDGVEVNWTPWAYLYRKGRGSQRWCYSFQANSAVLAEAVRMEGAPTHFIAPLDDGQDDGPGASTVLGASWMMHQDTAKTLTKNLWL